jgi:hypothetical protein
VIGRDVPNSVSYLESPRAIGTVIQTEIGWRVALMCDTYVLCDPPPPAYLKEWKAVGIRPIGKHAQEVFLEMIPIRIATCGSRGEPGQSDLANPNDLLRRDRGFDALWSGAIPAAGYSR